MTRIGPLVASGGTLAMICESPMNEGFLAGTVLNTTFVIPVKFDPLIVTNAPGAVMVGVNESIVIGCVVTWIRLVRWPVLPSPVVTMNDGRYVPSCPAT